MQTFHEYGNVIKELKMRLNKCTHIKTKPTPSVLKKSSSPEPVVKQQPYSKTHNYVKMMAKIIESTLVSETPLQETNGTPAPFPTNEPNCTWRFGWNMSYTVAGIEEPPEPPTLI